MSSVSFPSTPQRVPTLEGEPATIEECAADLLRACSVFDDLDTEATSQSLLENWQGAAASAYQDRVAEVAKDGAAASAAVRAAAKAMYDYRDTFDRLSYHHDLLVDWRGRITSNLHYLSGLVRRGTYEDGSISHLVSDLRRTISDYDASCVRLEESIAANDAELLAVLNSLMTVQAGHRAAAGGDIADAVMERSGSPLHGAAPEEVAEWWRSLSEDEQFAVIAAYPDIIGAANGPPAAARDRANRILLERDIEALDLAEATDEITPELYAKRKNIRAAQEALENAEGTSGVNSSLTRDPITDELIPAFLLLYRPDDFGGDGAIALAIGDPDTADNVSVSVPGINTTGASIPNYTKEVQHLYESARLSDPNASSATITWIGYDHPSGWGLGNTLSESAAKDGGERLSSYVDGLQASRTTKPQHMTVIGHSYGSTTSAHAAAGPGLDADNLVLIGSPGASGGVKNADDLNVPGVWTGTNSHDPVPANFGDKGWFGAGTFFGAGLGRDPAEDTFGATRFRAEDPRRNTNPLNLDDHSRYYDRGTESIFNMGQIMVGDHHEVTIAEHRHDPMWQVPTEPEWDRTPLSLDENRKRDIQ